MNNSEAKTNKYNDDDRELLDGYNELDVRV